MMNNRDNSLKATSAQGSTCDKALQGEPSTVAINYVNLKSVSRVYSTASGGIEPISRSCLHQ